MTFKPGLPAEAMLQPPRTLIPRMNCGSIFADHGRAPLAGTVRSDRGAGWHLAHLLLKLIIKLIDRIETGRVWITGRSNAGRS